MDYELKYGIDGNGHFVSINDVVAKGLGCGCVCPNCKQQLVAKIKGDKRKPHFAHYNPQHGADKKKCYENTMHLLAKNIIKEGLSIMLPSLDCIPSKRVVFIDVEKEKRNDNKYLQPDIVGITEEGKRIAIEIKYSHAVDTIKLHKIIENRLTCMEVDISKCDMDKNELQEFLCDSDKDREWLNNPDYEEKIIEHYSNSFDDVIIEEKQEVIIKRRQSMFRDIVVISEIERYKQKHYQVKGREKSSSSDDSHIRENKTTPKHHTIDQSGNQLYKEEGSVTAIPRQRENKPLSKVVIRLYGADSETSRIVTDNRFYCLCPKETSDHILQNYYDALLPHKIFYDNDLIQTKIANYKIVGNRIAVIHIYSNNNKYFTRLTGIELVHGRIQHIELGEFRYEISAEQEMTKWLLRAK